VTLEEVTRALPALGGAGAMLLIARFVWSMSVAELDRLRTQLSRVEGERDHFATVAALYRRALVDNGIALPVEIEPPPKRNKAL